MGPSISQKLFLQYLRVSKKDKHLLFYLTARTFSTSDVHYQNVDDLPHLVKNLADEDNVNRNELSKDETDSNDTAFYLYLKKTDFAHPKGLRYTQSTNSNGSVQKIPLPKRTSFLDSQIQVPFPEIKLAFRGLDSTFPCVIKGKLSGPEPSYDTTHTGYKLFLYKSPFPLKNSKGILPQLQLAYETWGTLNEDKSNAVLLFTGLSASSHAKSHKENENPGWWEKFIGPGCALDTDKFFIICCNNLGGCYGTTGPSSINPLTEKSYGSTFPIIAVEDMVQAQFLLLDDLGIDQVYASVGSSLGAMQAITASVLFPKRVQKTIAISGTTETHPSGIALRYLQRKAIMMDPDWAGGHYYNVGKFPKAGMKLAREIATITYRSGPEWDERFGRRPINKDAEPSLCPHFMIENYIEYQGETFSTKYDPNSLLYISKAMDLFDLSETSGTTHAALAKVVGPVMVIGVKTDMLFPVWQQRDMALKLQEAGNDAVTYYELNSIYGHDTFLLDLNGVGTAVKGFLETHNVEKGTTCKNTKNNFED